jgi:hypothetical protein
MPGESLTEYIERRRREFESKADGGSIGIEVLFTDKKANGGRVGMLSGGLLSKGIMGALEQIKNMDEGNLFSKLDPLGKAKTIKDALLDRIEGFKEIIKDLKTQGRPVDEIEDIKFEMDEAKDGLEKINKYIKNQPTNRTLQADGGRVGLFMGGPALEGQALAIYNSMNATGATDQAIADRLQSLGLYTPGGTTQTTQPNIIGAQLNQDRGGGRDITELQETFTRAAGSTPSISEDAFFGLGRFLQGKERGTLGTRLANQPRLPLPGAIAAYSRSPFNPNSPTYNPDFADQLNFLELGDGLIGLSSVGYKYGPNSVLSGQNVISGFGTNDYLQQLNKFLAKTKSDKRRQQGIEEKARFIMAEEKRKEEEARKIQLQDAAEVERLNKLGRDVSRGGFDPTGPTQRSITKSRDDRSGGGGHTNPGKGSYGPHMAQGGLATMFTRRR